MRRLWLLFLLTLSAYSPAAEALVIDWMQAVRWASGADIVLMPAATASPAATDTLTHFWLTASNLETLLEVALRADAEAPPLVSGARIDWNPLRPPYDRIFAVHLLDTEVGLAGPAADWHLLVGDDRLVAVVMPRSMSGQLIEVAAPWFAPLVRRQQSGLPVTEDEAAPPARQMPEAAVLVEQWRQQGWDQVASAADSGYRRELSLRPAAWFGRVSLHGVLTGLLCLAGLALLTLLGQRYARRSLR